jgi:hypothetical protein
MNKEFIQQIAQDGTVKFEVGVASVALTSSWWMPHFDTVIHVILALGAVGMIGSRIAIMWLQYRNNKTGK